MINDNVSTKFICYAPRKLFCGLMNSFSSLLSDALPTWLVMGESGPAVPTTISC